MSKPVHEDPERRAARAARRRRRHEHIAAGREMLPRQSRPSAQMDHGSNPKGKRQARDGELAMQRERSQER